MPQTPSQTIGPFFAYGLTPASYGHPGIAHNVLVGPATQGNTIQIRGRVLDGAGQPVSDALVEIWQANSAGRYHHPNDQRPDIDLDPDFQGFGRCATEGDGGFSFQTIKPGRVPGRGNTLQAPHISVVIFARGLLSQVYTRLYFADEPEANGEDMLLEQVPTARRPTLLAERDDSGDEPVYTLDIHLQGIQETVFFDV